MKGVQVNKKEVPCGASFWTQKKPPENSGGSYIFCLEN